MVKKGGVPIYILTIVFVLTIGMSLIYMFSINTINEQRYKIQNGVTASVMALYSAVEQGNPAVVSQFTPDELQKYLSDPYSIKTLEQQGLYYHTDLINLLTCSYFTKGQRYKCIYLDKEQALEVFKEYLCRNLNVYEDPSNPNIFLPNNDNPNIIRVELQEFFVRNAVPYWDEDTNNPNNDLLGRKYTSVHVKLMAYVKNSITKVARIPIHIDSDLTAYRYLH